MEAVAVTFVSSHAGRGGSERYLSLLLDDVPRESISSVVCLKEGALADELREKRYPIEIIATGPGLVDIVGAARTLRRSLRRTQPAVVHANGMKAALVSELATLGASTPVIWVKHDLAREGWLARLVSHRAARVIGVSAAVIAAVDDGRHVEVLYSQIPDPAVDRGDARRAVIQEFVSDDVDAVLTLVGRLDPYKGHAELIAVAAPILSAAPGTRFLFVGGDDPSHPGQRDALMHQVTELGIEHAVRFTGHRTDAVELIAGSDVLVVPSVARDGFGMEGFPYVGLEALAVRTPVVCYAHGGLPEQIGECGVLVPPDDRDALSRALLSLIGDSALRDQLSACGRRRFEQSFCWSTLPDAMIERYRQVAEEASR